jgi:glycerol-3-phosphate dehydrogenase (NAD(P)+)
MRIGIIGSGAFGCALAHTFSKNNEIIMWSYTEEEKNSINNNHECLTVKNIKLDNSITASNNLEEVVNKSDLLVLVTPSDTVRNMCKNIKKIYNNQQILLASKGMENDKLLTNVIKEELNADASVIMGPSFAEEIGYDLPTFVELSGNMELIKYLENDKFKIFYNNDSIGLQIGGSLKNVITVASGVVEGLGYKVNTISYIITEGLEEIKKIGMKLGAKESTFYGLSGLGDLYGTSLSNKSRNKRAGILIGQGKKLEDIYNEVGSTIEGLDTVKDAFYIINKYNLDCPLIKNLYNILYNDMDFNKII